MTETLAPFLTPAVALVHQLGYCHQSLRGEFVGGTEQKVQPAVDSLRTTFDGVRDAAQKFVRAFPCLAGARLVRHWAGVIDVAADLAPILCETEVGGFWLDCGWVYGFMGAPAGGQLLAEAITTGAMPPPALPFSLSRLREGRLIAEGSLVVVLEGT